jgi:hypothetical protein
MYWPAGVISGLLAAAIIDTDEAIIIICVDCLADELLGIHENS